MKLYLLSLLLTFSLVSNTAGATDIPIEFYDNEIAVNGILEIIASSTDSDLMTAEAACLESCEDRFPERLFYNICSSLCREVYSIQHAAE